MDFIEGSIGIYKPLMEFFHTRAYQQSVQTCWNTVSYNFQQKNLIPTEFTVEAMADLLVEESKNSLRIKLWEFEVEDCFKAESKLVFEVNTSMKMRDIEFEARRLLVSPEMIPLQLKHTRIFRKAEQLVDILKKQEDTSDNLLSLRDMVIKVLPKVLQIFWLPAPGPAFTMPSRYLSKMAVGVTQAVVDRVSQTMSSIYIQFSNCVRDNLVLSIQEKVRQAFTPDDLVENIHSFQPEFLTTIRDVTVEEIGALSSLFLPLPPSPSPDVSSASETASTDDDNSVEKPVNEEDDNVIEETVDLSIAQVVPSSNHVNTMKPSIFSDISNWMQIPFLKKCRLRS
ncbi:uncharacterized protein LOC130915142 isoform X2 [Corythoichthys intestinalis]|uniref:uncharacterized protein LOC130915142 isoform X2 n=1 Tax=Corythoichthys intestinalis TaxID=161448 RepID=UPI0025A51871|nr:uncharacterized protein LOC130915142 isoform X2 [Corythoichthys intestinalis]